MNKYWPVAVVLGCSMMGALAQIYFKKAMGFDWLQIFKHWYIYAGILLYISAFVLYMYALRYENVSILYPIIALSYVWIVFLAAFMLDESISYQKMVGSGVIIIGVYLIGSAV